MRADMVQQFLFQFVGNDTVGRGVQRQNGQMRVADALNHESHDGNRATDGRKIKTSATITKINGQDQQAGGQAMHGGRTRPGAEYGLQINHDRHCLTRRPQWAAPMVSPNRLAHKREYVPRQVQDLNAFR